MGPNVRALVARKMSVDTVPNGCADGFGEALKLFSDPAVLKARAVAATKWVAEAMEAVRATKGPNPFRDATDEEVAGEILRATIERERAQGAKCG